jgi:hypothetical protein
LDGGGVAVEALMRPRLEDEVPSASKHSGPTSRIRRFRLESGSVREQVFVAVGDRELGGAMFARHGSG